jgi:hypothetical protein
MTSIHDNPERAKAIIRAIQECAACREQPTFANVTEKLPHNQGPFDLLEEELIEALGECGPSIPAEARPLVDLPESEPLKNFDVPREAQAETADIPPADTTPDAEITRERAQQMVEAAHKRLGAARVAVRIAQQRHTDTKGRLAAVITAWQTASDSLTSEARQQREHRNYLASELARKQALAAAGVRPNRMRTDKHPARDPMTGRVGHKGNHRGAFPSSYQHRNVNSPTSFQRKVPGEA